jgi:hypothetical protein
VLTAGQKLGKPLTLKDTLTIAEITAAPENFVGKAVQVKGKVTEVCQNMGCWMALTDPATSKMIKVKVKDGEIVFPKEAVGKMAVAEGKLAKISLTKDQAIAQAKHEAEEQGRTFNPDSVTGPVVNYQIQGTGAEILE